MSTVGTRDWDKQERCVSEVQVEHGVRLEQLFCFAAPLTEGMAG